MDKNPKYVKLLEDVVGPEINNGANRQTVEEGDVAAVVRAYVSVDNYPCLRVVDGLNRPYNVLAAATVEITKEQYLLERLRRREY